MAASLVSKKWYKTHGITIKLKSGVTITSVSRKALDIMGIASLLVILAPTLEVDLGDMAVGLGEFFKFFMGMDVISDF